MKNCERCGKPFDQGSTRRRVCDNCKKFGDRPPSLVEASRMAAQQHTTYGKSMQEFYRQQTRK